MIKIASQNNQSFCWMGKLCAKLMTPLLSEELHGFTFKVCLWRETWNIFECKTTELISTQLVCVHNTLLSISRTKTFLVQGCFWIFRKAAKPNFTKLEYSYFDKQFSTHKCSSRWLWLWWYGVLMLVISAIFFTVSDEIRKKFKSTRHR